MLGSAAAVGFGGFVGALARWGTAMMAAGTLGTRFAWGTLIANLLGCFAMGCLRTVFDRTGIATPELTLALMTGFLGAYTTFSAFSADTIYLARSAGPRFAVAYVAVSVVGGVFLCWAGMRLAGSALATQG